MPRGNTQPSLLRMLQSRFLTQIKTYNKAHTELNNLLELMNEDGSTFDRGELYEKLKAKERLTRGIVRGSAQMLIIISNPAQAKDNDAINDLEYDSGLQGINRSKPKARASDMSKAFLDQYYDRG